METEIGSDETVSSAVLRAVCAVVGQEPRSLQPLEQVVDTDALDALFESRQSGEPRPGGRLSFIYANCRVTIYSGEYLTIRQLDTLD
jgi:hypothetical protein